MLEDANVILYISCGIMLVTTGINLGTAYILYKVHKIKEKITKELQETIQIRRLMLEERFAREELS